MIRSVAVAVAYSFLSVTVADHLVAQSSDLLAHIPPAANTIVVIDVDGCHNCPLGKKENWKEKHEAGFVDGPVFLPPQASKMVMAARIDPLTGTTAWELAVMQLNETLSMRAIARAEGGYTDTVNGAETVWSPRNAYAIKFGPRTVGVMYPANRQYLSRWAEYSRSARTSAVTPYLRRAAENLGPAQIVMAMDLKDVASPHDIGAKLDASSVLKDKGADLKAIGSTIMGLRGVTLAVKIGDRPEGTLTVDFAGSAAALAPFAKDMILNTLDERGAAIEDFRDWRGETSGKQVKLQGTLSNEALRRLLSVVELPTPGAMSEKSLGRLKTDEGKEATVKATQTHFKSVTHLIDGIHYKKGAKTLGQKAAWMETYARKIDRLPVLNVDPDMVNWSHQVAQSLRDSAKAWRTAGVRSAANRPVYGNTTTSGVFYAGSNSYRNAQNNRVRNQENAVAAKANLNGWESIENSIGEMRQTMTARYGVEF